MASPWRDRTLFILLLLPVGLVAGMAPRVRPITDDLCYEAAVAGRGVLGAWWSFVQSWSGTWLQHGLSSVVAGPERWWGYAVQAVLLLALLVLACWALAGREWLAGLALAVCALVALQGSVVGPAYPGLAGAFAFPAAGLLHLLPLLLWLPLTAAATARGLPLAVGVPVAVLLTGTGLAEGAAALLLWLGLAVRMRRDRGAVLRWGVPSLVLAAGLLAVYLSPGSRMRAAQLALEPSSADLALHPVIELPAYIVLYSGGLITSPGVILALLLGLALGRRASAPSDVVVLAAVPALLLAQAAAAVFAYPAFWHLQALQLAGACAALVLGRLLPLPRPGLRPVLAGTALFALVPTGIAAAAVSQRAEVVDAALVAGRLPGYALGVPGGAVLPDAGDGSQGYATCWRGWTGASAPAEVGGGARGVWPTVPLPLLG
ncbi:MAG: hypothetical protein JWN57_1969 [Frankiales bacterium]|nr:hypothetical protein [Frankiales bacterium]